MAGTLNLRSIRAELGDEAGKADVYCAFHLGDQEVHSEVDKKGGKHPEWNELFHFDLTGSELIFIVRVYKSKHFVKDQMIGEGSLELHELIQSEKFERWVELKHHQAIAGKILIQAEFIPLVGENPAITVAEKKSSLDKYKEKLIAGYSQNKEKLLQKYNTYMDLATKEINETNAKKAAAKSEVEVDVKTEVIPGQAVVSEKIIKSGGEVENVMVVPVAVVETAQVKGENVAAKELTIVPVEVTEKDIKAYEKHGIAGKIDDLKHNISGKIEEAKAKHQESKLEKEIAKGETVVVTESNYIVPEVKHKEYKEPLDLLNMSDKSSPVKTSAGASVQASANVQAGGSFEQNTSDGKPFKFV